MEKIAFWFKRQIANPQVVSLTIVLLGLFLVIMYAGGILTPVLAAIVIAYLLEGLIGKLTQAKMSRTLAVWLVFLAFMLFLVLVVLGLLPILYKQLTQVVAQIPDILASGQTAVLALPEKYPEWFSVNQVEEIIRDIIDSMRAQLNAIGQNLVTTSLSHAASVIIVLIYLILVPLLVFFFLHDKKRILIWFTGVLPQDQQLAVQIWREVDLQVSNYIRGKFWEILIVWFFSYLCFSHFGLQFSMLLAVLVGLSVLIPYVGAAVVTIPVLLIAWFQWGWTNDFIYVITIYLIIQGLDGNLLVPLLFSEAVNIHPVAIVVAVLFFGGLWGVWGVFFAIPLATLVHAIIIAWPKSSVIEKDS